jgi:hypothetical protein
LLEGQIGRFGAFEDAVDEIGNPLAPFFTVRAVSRQPAVTRKKLVFVNGRHQVGGSKLENPLAVEGSESIRNHKDPVWHLGGHRGERRVEIVRFAHAEGLHGHAKLRHAASARSGCAAPKWLAPLHGGRHEFAPDSSLEGDGFELPVPVRQAKLTRFCR